MAALVADDPHKPLPKREKKKARDGSLLGVFTFSRKKDKADGTPGSVVNDGDKSSTVGSELAPSAGTAARAARTARKAPRGRRPSASGSEASFRAPPSEATDDALSEAPDDAVSEAFEPAPSEATDDALSDAGAAGEALPRAAKALYKSGGAEKRAFLDAWVAAQLARGVEPTKGDAMGYLRSVGVDLRKVPARKPVATCRRCAAAPAGGPAPRLEALPVADECGRGRFECQECGHGWTSNTAHRSLAQYCNECDAVDAQRGTFPLEIRAARPLWLIHKLQKRYLEGRGAAPAQNAPFAGLADIPEDAASEHPPPRAAPPAAPPPPSSNSAAASGLGDGDYCVVAPAGRADADEPAGTFYYDRARGGGGGGGTTYYEPTPAVADTKIVVEPREGDAAAAPPLKAAPKRLGLRAHHCSGCATGRCKRPPPVSKTHVSTGSTATSLSTKTWSTGGSSAYTCGSINSKYDPADLVLIDGLLARGECDALIAAAEAETFGSTGFTRQCRGNLRLITTDASLADALWARLRPLVPATVTHKGATWDAYGCNERLRLALYHPGDRFASHLDADYRRGDGDGSMFTVNIYLNDVVDGGRTRFEGGERGRERPVRLAVAPAAGRAVVFAQPSAGRYLYHDGEPLGSGRKYLLRTDVMYRRRGAPRGTGRAERRRAREARDGVAVRDERGAVELGRLRRARVRGRGERALRGPARSGSVASSARRAARLAADASA
ncbi:prolyl 4-hydroxylase alpha-subunit [Aureococcus anophagefferens]|nr:prolyl 4-hydroxylase alpha-subunit [Aureococcus anophagefferens]